MSYDAKIIEDSISQGVRLTTMQVTLPRIVLAEFNTHRMFSRNSASSRAIPVEKRIKQIENDPFIPEAFARNIAGMQAGDVLDYAEATNARHAWLAARDAACVYARRLADLGVHKQWANRILEPFSWHTIVVTSTEWVNFFNLRIHSAAQPEIRLAAKLMLAAMEASTPAELLLGGWHLPYVTAEERKRLAHEEARSVSVVRCARVSYDRQGESKTLAEDIARHDDLLVNRHMSPFEHQATNGGGFEHEFIGNFRAPWLQYRKMLSGEDVAPAEIIHV